MSQARPNPKIPVWRADQLDSPEPPQGESPYFDQDLGAWVLSRHADLLATFNAPAACPASTKAGKQPPPPMDMESASSLKMRAETQDQLSPTRLKAWREQLESKVENLIRALPADEPIDLLRHYAAPACLFLAETVTSIPHQEALSLLPAAKISSASAAEPHDAELGAAAKAAEKELAKHFQSAPQPLAESTFVALSQTLTCILGNAWFALLKHPDQWSLLHQQPRLMDLAMEELLRYAGLVRTLGRYATADFHVGETLIRGGDRMILRVMSGNRDPNYYPDPNRLDVERISKGNFSLGAGPHACLGASLIRMAMVTTTRPLVQRFGSADLIEETQWKGGSGFRSPSSLRVRLTGISTTG